MGGQDIVKGLQKRNSHCKRDLTVKDFCPTVHDEKHIPTRDVQAELCSPWIETGMRQRTAPRVVVDQMSISICSHKPEMPASLGWACGFVDGGIAVHKRRT